MSALQQVNQRRRYEVRVGECHLNRYRDVAIRLRARPIVVLSLIARVVCVRLLLVRFLQLVKSFRHCSLNNLRHYDVRHGVDVAALIGGRNQEHRQLDHRRDRAYVLHW